MEKCEAREQYPGLSRAQCDDFDRYIYDLLTHQQEFVSLMTDYCPIDVQIVNPYVFIAGLCAGLGMALDTFRGVRFVMGEKK